MKLPFVTHWSAPFHCAAAWRSAPRRNGIAGTWAFREGVAERGELAHTRHTAEFIAQLRGESLAQLAAHTTATADVFFRFPR